MALEAQDPPPAGWKWSCSEQIWSEGYDGTAHGILEGLIEEPGHRHYGGVMGLAASTFPVYVDYGAVRWPGGGAAVVVEMCMVYNDDGDTVASGSLPGDTWP